MSQNHGALVSAAALALLCIVSPAYGAEWAELDAFCDGRVSASGCSGTAGLEETICEAGQSRSRNVAPHCIEVMHALSAQLMALQAQGYKPLEDPKVATSNENCVTQRHGALDGLPCLTVMTQAYHSEAEDQSLLLCVAQDSSATNIAIACGGGGGLNIAPLALGRFVQAQAHGSGIEVITTVESRDLDAPLRWVSISNRLDPAQSND